MLFPLSYLLFLIPFLLFVFFYDRFHDDGTPYFDLENGYRHVYSEFRSREADDFIRESAVSPFERTTSSSPFLCVGMLTLARPTGVVYFRKSIASLIAGLTREERDDIYVIPFVTHTDPTGHPAYGETWLNNVVDRVLTYNTSEILTQEEYAHIRDLEAERIKSGRPDREKHMFDYGLLLKTCAAVDAPYVAMFEDDIIALDGWYHRTKAALLEIERLNRLKGIADFFYLRLFYREIQRDMRYQLILVLFVTNTIIFILLRKAPLVRQRWYILFPGVNIALALGVILLIKAAMVTGGLRLPGVYEMPTGGCCAQGVVYPTTKIKMLTDWYTENKIGFVDSLAEKLADEHPEKTGARWALRPAVLQHVGGKSSKGDNWGSDKPGEMSEAQRIWNFEFEKNKAAQLAKEHQEAAAKAKSTT